MRRFFTITCLFLMPLLNHAQQIIVQDSLVILEEIRINNHAELRTPVTFHNLNAEYLEERSTGQEPSFLFSETPSMTVYSDAGNSQGYSYLRMRGIDQTRINLSIDGVPLNEPEDQGAYLSNFPDILNSIDKVQIQRGVGTSQNGVASFAGSIALSSPDGKQTRSFRIGAGYGSFNTYRAFGEYSSGLKKHTNIYLRLSHLHSDGYKYRSANTGSSIFFSSTTFSQKMIWKVNLIAGHQKNQLSWLGVPEKAILADARTNANAAEDDRFTQSIVQLQHIWKLSGKNKLISSFYHTYLKGNYDFDLNNFLGLPQNEELYNYAFRSGMSGFFSNYRHNWQKNSLVAGMHAYAYQRSHHGSERSLGSLYRNIGLKKELSTFIKAEHDIGKIMIFGDVQFRITDFRYLGSTQMDKHTWTFLNPKAGVNYVHSSKFSFYYSIGHTGREPTRNDMFGGNDDLGKDVHGKPELYILDPEFVLDQELGMRLQQKKGYVHINFYHMEFKNEIVLNGNFGPNGLALTSNVERSFRSGIELSAKKLLTKRTILINNSSFNFSKIKEQGQVFSPILTPALIINQEAQYSFSDLTLSIIYRYQSSSFIDFGNQHNLSNYHYMNARLQYRLKKHWDLMIFANNITNTRFFNHGYVDEDGSGRYFIQAPRNFYTSIIYKFI